MTEGLFHVHSTYSYDGRDCIDDLKQFCVRNKYSFACLTEHSYGMTTEKWASFLHDCTAVSDNDVLMVPGLEYESEDNRNLHLLAIGIRNFRDNTGTEEFLQDVKSQGGIVVMAHPSRSSYEIPEEIARHLDGVEVWNAAYDSRYLPDHKAILAYSRLRRRTPGLFAVGGLDMHDLRNFREVTLELGGAVQTEVELLEMLRQGDFLTRGRLMSFAGDMRISPWSIFWLGCGRGVLEVADKAVRILRRKVRSNVQDD